MSLGWPQQAILFVVALVAAPFIATGIFRIIPGYSDVQLLLPLVVAGAVGVAVERLRPSWRPLWLGLLVGGMLHIAFLVWLFAEWSGVNRMG